MPLKINYLFVSQTLVVACELDSLVTFPYNRCRASNRKKIFDIQVYTNDQTICSDMSWNYHLLVTHVVWHWHHVKLQHLRFHFSGNPRFPSLFAHNLHFNSYEYLC
ncbi:hypothetical protein V1514DRAFT_334150 [Lipomyces japonicus]|uniref:uncharacterized protein n=1 Tax=Lipomyces japonicus TaxID=56871 RepID=UPI0034CE29CF